VSASGALILALLIAASPAVAEQIVPPAARDVTPPGVTPGPTGVGPLIREPPPPRAPEPPRWRRYFLPVTADAATFVIDSLTISIAGVTPPAVGDTCTFTDGEPWPCGHTALYALRMFLRGRAVECYFPPVEGLAEVIAPCRVGQTDLGLWLLKSGWARTNDLATSDYLTAMAEARCARLGMWRGVERPDFCPGAVETEAAPQPHSQDQTSSGPSLPD
jgi:endonuclease YncB( thermonuclease family)